jgi:NTP pyrophosphatase (non-canonical NTP hydrolase)
MNFDGYQDFCITTAIYPKRHQNVQYVALGLAGETGEFVNKVKKVERDNGGRITHESREALAEELGDILWYVAMAADEINLSLESIVKNNIAKLTGRTERNTIRGNGDKR